MVSERHATGPAVIAAGPVAARSALASSRRHPSLTAGEGDFSEFVKVRSRTTDGTRSTKRQTHREVGTQSHGALEVSRATERRENTDMKVRTHEPHRGLRRFTSRLFPSRERPRESAIAWLSADPIFDRVAACERG